MSFFGGGGGGELAPSRPCLGDEDNLGSPSCLLEAADKLVVSDGKVMVISKK